MSRSAFFLRLRLLALAACSSCAVEARAAAAAPATQPTADQNVFFESKVRPLLIENCFGCHGPQKQKGRLRLDSIEAALKGGENGPALIVGHPEQSRLILAVSYKDADFQMPPKERLSDQQIAILTDWVAMGAPWPGLSGRMPLTKSKHRVITDEDRAFWSFRPVVDPAVPQVDDGGWSKNPMDRFVFAKLKAEGLSPAPEADRLTLIRRATFDLTGLPPTTQEIDAFVNDKSPDAYEKLIDRLLASPHYGERYGRHWLDLVRYAESDGFKQDAYREEAWPYRDYVIRSFNDDKPYNRFVAEQLAGDEIDPNDPDALAGTAYLRNGMYEYNQRNAEGQWHDTLNDITDVTADTFLGLSMGCARCHDHKFDPILQADYFKLQSFFSAILPRNDMTLATAAQRQQHDERLRAWEKKTEPIRAQIDAILKQTRGNAVARIISKFPPPVQAMLNKPQAQRGPYERQIAYLVKRQIDEEFEKLDEKITGEKKDKLIALRKQLGQFDSELPKELQATLAVTDVGPVAPPTSIPGDSQNRQFDPGYPIVMDRLPMKLPQIKASATSTGRRTALANWITDPANPVTTRVITNRIWQWHFGKGIVRTSSDYGKLGDRPSHPELLDWLTRRFVDGTGAGSTGSPQADSGWRMKQMHRLIMTSATYRQASVRKMPEVAKLKDPENRLLWRFNTQRLEAEQVRDAMLAVSGELDGKSGGPAAETTATRRTIYTKAVRNVRDPLLEVFDLPDAFGSVPVRNQTTTATQSLLLVNGDWPLKRATAFAMRLTRDVNTVDSGALVDAAYRLAYGREPRVGERSAAIKYLNSRPAAEIAVADPAARAPADGAVGWAPPTSSPQKPSHATSAKVGSAHPTDSTSAVTGTAFDMPVTQLMPQRGTQAILFRNANPADLLRLSYDPSFPDGDFTIEAYVQLESLYENASVRVIASQWSGRNEEPGWSFGVTSEKSKYLPRNLILQLAGKGADGKIAYEVIPSDFRLELHKAYYVAVSVKLTDASEGGIVFYIKDLTDMDAPLRSAGVKHTMTGAYHNESPLILGGRDGGKVHGWDGLIDEVRLSRAALTSDQLLYNEGPAGKAIVGHWLFEETPGYLKDSAGLQKDLTRKSTLASAAPTTKKPPSKSTAKTAAKAPDTKMKQPAGPTVKVDAALVDFCHALLNSSEFLYVD